MTLPLTGSAPKAEPADTADSRIRPAVRTAHFDRMRFISPAPCLLFRSCDVTVMLFRAVYMKKTALLSRQEDEVLPSHPEEQIGEIHAGPDEGGKRHGPPEFPVRRGGFRFAGPTGKARFLQQRFELGGTQRHPCQVAPDLSPGVGKGCDPGTGCGPALGLFAIFRRK